jgi:hypothetical protein
MRVLRGLYRAQIVTPLGLTVLCATALTSGAFGAGPVVFIGYGAMLIALLLALSEAVKHGAIDAAGMAAGDPTWQAHIGSAQSTVFGSAYPRGLVSPC